MHYCHLLFFYLFCSSLFLYSFALLPCDLVTVFSVMLGFLILFLCVCLLYIFGLCLPWGIYIYIWLSYPQTFFDLSLHYLSCWCFLWYTVAKSRACEPICRENPHFQLNFLLIVDLYKTVKNNTERPLNLLSNFLQWYHFAKLWYNITNIIIFWSYFLSIKT